MITINIAPKDHGRSLGNFLKKELRIPTALIHKLLRKNKIKLNNLKPDLNWKLASNLELKIYSNIEQKKESKNAIPAQFFKKHFHIIYEDENILALNKQPGIAVQPTKNIPYEKTLIGLLDYYGKSHNFTAKLLHRLDKDTSGVILSTKNPASYQELYCQFENRSIKKTYLALVKGHTSEHFNCNTKISDNKNKIVSAQTEFRTLETFPEYSLVEASPFTGRFHQIRKHLSLLGHTIVHDELYGDFRFNRQFQKKYHLLRQFLHALSIQFTLFGKKFLLKAPITADLQKTLNALRKI